MKRVLRSVVTIWALAGGAVLLGVVAINVASVVLGMAGRSFPGDFELTQLGTAVAVFAFLPYCQWSGSNVTAGIFTSGAGRRTRANLQTAAQGVALIVASVLLWRLALGLADQKSYGATTAILQVPIWWAYAAGVVSLGLLCVTAAFQFAAGVSPNSGGRGFRDRKT